LGLKWNEVYHDEDDVVLILMSLMVLKTDFMSSYIGLWEMSKRVIYQAKRALCHLIYTCYFGMPELFLELFLAIVVSLST